MAKPQMKVKELRELQKDLLKTGTKEGIESALAIKAVLESAEVPFGKLADKKEEAANAHSAKTSAETNTVATPNVNDSCHDAGMIEVCKRNITPLNAANVVNLADPNPILHAQATAVTEIKKDKMSFLANGKDCNQNSIDELRQKPGVDQAIRYYVQEANQLHARRCADKIKIGEVCKKVRKLVGHGHWTKEAFPALGFAFSYRTATRYMYPKPPKPKKPKPSMAVPVETEQTENKAGKPTPPMRANVAATFTPGELEKAKDEPVQPYTMVLTTDSVVIDWTITPKFTSIFSALQEKAVGIDAAISALMTANPEKTIKTQLVWEVA